jgi:hypothetical protein
MKKFKFFITGFIILSMIPGLGFSGTIHVPADYVTIQEAIDASEDGDTILVADGIYTGDGNINLELNDKEIVVKSTNGPENCTIDGTGENNPKGFFMRDSLVKCIAVIDGFTIKNCNTGFYFSGGLLSPVVKNNIINNCSYAIYCDM